MVSARRWHLRGIEFTALVLLVVPLTSNSRAPNPHPNSPAQAESPQATAEVKAELASYVVAHYMTPEDYILSKFKDHDIVFVGELHRIKHDPELIQALIPRLYENGIYTLGTEFARREDQALIDEVLNGPEYDEALARQIQFNNLAVWGYQEYVDIYKAAWQLNRNLPDASRRFRILGLNDSPDWSFIQKAEDRDDPVVMKKVWRGGGEHLYAKVILDEVVAKGEKALIYSGIHHAFTEYLQPIFDSQKQSFIRFEETRMGNFVYRRIGKRAITIFLHAPWPSAKGYDEPLVRPADGVIDAVMGGLDPKYRRVGFDTWGTPFGKLPAETSLYKYGYGKYFALEKFCDGYIYQKDFSEYEGVTVIPDFINAANLDEARRQMPHPSYRTASAEDLQRVMAENADIRQRLIPQR